MGANPTQAYGVMLFYLAFVAIAGAFASGGSLALLAAGILLIGLSVLVFLKCKPWEDAER
jgi:hypothetical protein